MSYTHFYCLLLQVQHRCHLLVEKAAKYIQESVYSERILSGLRNNMGKLKVRGKNNYSEICLISGKVPENPGRMHTLL